MKLKLIREHYAKNVGTKWIPKRSFINKDDIKKQLGFDPDKCETYTCDFCNKLHIRSPDWKINDVAG